jgi:hypothetical protein
MRRDHRLLDAFTATGIADEVVQKIEGFSRIAMTILQPIGADIDDIRTVLETGHTYLQQ